MGLLTDLINVEWLLSEGANDDFEQYCSSGLKLDPDDPGFNRGKGSKFDYR